MECCTIPLCGVPDDGRGTTHAAGDFLEGSRTMAEINDWKKCKGREKREKYYTSPEWAALKDAVRKRCGNVCEACESRPMYALHHVTYQRLYHEELTDLAGLCEECHKAQHSLAEKEDSPRVIHNAIKDYLWRQMECCGTWPLSEEDFERCLSMLNEMDGDRRGLRNVADLSRSVANCNVEFFYDLYERLEKEWTTWDVNILYEYGRQLRNMEDAVCEWFNNKK